ncbi:3-deoxy-7-phosphoheptulonate synthase [Candidatus Kapabacteria bacterium]|nr:3-deoxy-7-phosphoheptulonate synthase [Candidatus Kapabacteria bacterium]
MNSTRTKEILKVIDSGPFIIAGPCSIESEEQIHRTAQDLSSKSVRLLRGGAFKPRTSPYSFQGLGYEGLKFMREAADLNDMFVVSEVLESDQLTNHHELIDIIQIGSRNMSSFGLLKQVGRITAPTGKPVLLKRGFSATISELLNAAEYIINEGNPNVILCLRGIRTFEQIDSYFRFTPDLGSIVELKEKTNLKVIYDPSHATGNAKYVTQFSKAAIQLGADGLIIESHYKPEEAKSDKLQCVHPSEVGNIISSISQLEYEIH